jgi:hypothetical protein
MNGNFAISEIAGGMGGIAARRVFCRAWRLRPDAGLCTLHKERGMTTAIMIAACFLGLAGPPGDDGFDWVVVGDPGNRAANAEEAPEFYPPFWPEPGLEAGDVAWEYRLTRTEITAAQWLEFVVAYAPFWDGNPSDPALTSIWILHDDGEYVIVEGAENRPVEMSWYNAARFCNWLHNGKVNEAWAFEDGAYDTSTFGLIDKDGNSLEQATRHPEALYWIPSLDEWTKGMYYDPDRYGEQDPGYWYMPDGGNENLISGLPEDGGETNAGIFDIYLDVGLYPQVTSPWGLLDGSGGTSEWTERQGGLDSRVHKGSWQFNETYWLWDKIDAIGITFPYFREGLRLASVTNPPCPGDCTGDGALDILDFVCLHQLFTSGSLLADVNGDHALNILDFVAFQEAFLAGCP